MENKQQYYITQVVLTVVNSSKNFLLASLA